MRIFFHANLARLRLIQLLRKMEKWDLRTELDWNSKFCFTLILFLYCFKKIQQNDSSAHTKHFLYDWGVPYNILNLLSFFSTQSSHKIPNRVPVSRFKPGSLDLMNPWTPHRVTLWHPGISWRIKALSLTQTSVRFTRPARPPYLLAASGQVNILNFYPMTLLW